MEAKHLQANLENLLTESSLDNIDDGLAGVDVGHNLSTTVGVFSAIFHDDDLRRKEVTHFQKEEEIKKLFIVKSRFNSLPLIYCSNLYSFNS